jgi:hypothetical protein
MIRRLSAAALSAAALFCAVSVCAQTQLPGGPTTSGGQRVDPAPVVIENTDGTLCNFKTGGNCGAGGGGGGGAVTAAENTYAAGFSPDVGDCATTTPYPGTGVPSLCALDWAIYLAAQSALPAQTSHGINIGGIEGITAQGASITENPLADGCRATTLPITVTVTDGEKVVLQCTSAGRLVVTPYAVGATQETGSASGSTSSAITLLAASTLYKHRVVSAQCWNTGTATLTIALNDTASTVIIVPTGSGNNPTFVVPLVGTAINTALTATPSAAPSGGGVFGCNVQGFLDF